MYFSENNYMELGYNGTYTHSDSTTVYYPANETLFPDSGMMRFSIWYGGIHGWVSICVCLFGIISNIVNIIVLTRRNMITPTNYLLTALAIGDILTMATYVPYAIYLYIIKVPAPLLNHSQGWVIYILFNNMFVITCHTMAMWLTVSLAIFRYIVVCHHAQGPKLCSLERAKLTIIIVSIASVVICIPNYLNYVIEDQRPINGHEGYWFNVSQINLDTNHAILTVSKWLYGVVFKITPCVFLVILSALLILAMSNANQRRRQLLSKMRRADDEHISEHNRTTVMLVSVVLFFVITELPQGITALWSGIDEDFFDNYYVPLGDMFDCLVLVNSAVNFILYCIMSRQFRQTFNELFMPKSCSLDILRKKNGGSPNGTQYSTIKTDVTQV